jgi:hypothetical protein
MIETEEQRRWWFATHPEYSWSRRGIRKEGGVDPEEVDKYVDKALKYETGPVADLLKSVKRNFGTEADAREADEELGSQKREEHDYREGWDDGYGAIHKGKAPPDLAREDKSAYARGVREGSATALDEREAWAQKWIDPILMLGGSHPSQTLGRNLKKDGEPRPSADHDAHHLVPWRHWRADPARDFLKKWDIPIDGSENGMWLQRTVHRTLGNNYEYMDGVTRLLERANSRKEALEVLGKIRNSLSNLKLPK